MSQQDFHNNPKNSEDEFLDELLRSARKSIYSDPEENSRENPDPVQPPEYADLPVEEEPEPEEEEAADGYRMPSVLKAIMYVCLVLAAAILLAVFAWNCADEVCALTAEDEIITVTVDENASMSDITQMLEDRGLIRYKWLFNLYCMLTKAEEKIDPGTYDLNAIYDYRALVYGMVETGENRATRTVLVPEGYELDDIFQMLEETEVCDAASLREAAANYAFDYWFLEGLEYGDYRRLEGYLFPDTYEFYVDDTPENVLSKFLRNFNVKVTEEMQADLDALNDELREKMAEGGFTESEIEASLLTFHDVVIVASLVEKESATTQESGRIASVIYNRLCSKLYPCLNIDATIQYVLPERKDTLSNADKAVISKYNTYTNAGLPIGPIANPGMNALRAALYPVDTDYYFYALDPSGVHHFSETVYEHQTYLDSLLGNPEENGEEGGSTEPADAD